MKTYQVNKSCRPAKLHDELQATGVQIITVRASYQPGTDIAPSAEIVTEDSAVDATVNAAIAAHSSEFTLPEKLDKLNLPTRLLAALAFRASVSWGPATASQKAAAQQIIDAAGVKVAQVIPL